jgi:hypothetical protein
VLAKSLYALPTWTRTVALVREYAALAAIALDGDLPSVSVCYRFTAKPSRALDMLDGCIADVIRSPRPTCIELPTLHAPSESGASFTSRFARPS